MKAIMISIKPKWVAKILNGEKTIEIRKTMPKCELPIDVYIYCTKDKPYLANATELFTGKYACISNDEVSYKEHNLNGKVVAKFTLNKVEEIEDCVDVLSTKSLDCMELLQKSCLMYEELHDYLPFRYDDSPRGYAIHISDLEIFDKPKELSEFRHVCELKNCKAKDKGCWYCGKHTRLNKAPQNMCYVEVEE